jgi:phosphate transport system substrate-binding protein
VYCTSCRIFLAIAFLSLALAPWGCARQGGKEGVTTIRVEGSDTMVNVAQAWAEEYHRVHPDTSVQVLGGGSGVGIASLIDGVCDMANTSRKMTEAELEKVKAMRGVPACYFEVGLDALAVYVNKDNPLDEITIEQLAEIFGEGGEITKWSQLLGAAPPWGNDQIVRVSRQNSSGTYAYFREAVLGKKRDYKLGSIDQSGSKDVVALIAHTPGAIGYSGMGYNIPSVKKLRVSSKGGAYIEASMENARKKDPRKLYPITRPLQIYTAGDPAGPLKDYLDWIKSPAGQKIVLDMGYVPMFPYE